jgi:hypothetical protein
VDGEALLVSVIHYLIHKPTAAVRASEGLEPAPPPKVSRSYWTVCIFVCS